MTPASLVLQWEEEVNKHAPTLKVLIYEGWSKLDKLDGVKGGDKKIASRRRKNYPATLNADEEDAAEDGGFANWSNYVNGYDIVLTTFNVLQSELGVARAPVIRPRRVTALDNYSDNIRVRSPLIMVEWARVIMDEVQLVGGRAAEMMSLIPRQHSLAVSGTPAKGAVSDLLQVLRFIFTKLYLPVN